MSLSIFSSLSTAAIYQFLKEGFPALCWHMHVHTHRLPQDTGRSHSMMSVSCRLTGMMHNTVVSKPTPRLGALQGLDWLLIPIKKPVIHSLQLPVKYLLRR